MIADPKNPFGDKIKMIKSLRWLSTVLGKLGIKCVIATYQMAFDPTVHVSYGMGLFHSKLIVESYIKKKRRTKQEIKHAAKLARREAKKYAQEDVANKI